MINVIEGQNLIAIAIQEHKNPLIAFEIALQNGVSITDELAGVQKLKYAVNIVEEPFALVDLRTIKNQFLNDVTVFDCQSIIDIAIQEGGSPFSAVDWSFKNNLTITDLLPVGRKLVSPNSIFKNDEIRNYFKSRSMNVATYRILEDYVLEISDYLLPGEFPYSF